ncbi:MAG: DUF2807 domain-containing protein [Cytophagaceae bacterium]|jgi:hypothetical protein|nr:DUF2807 domain-containing protein [Cytophagaceae bacterium]
MKKGFFLMIIIAACLLSSCHGGFFEDGNGHLVTTERDVAAFDRLKIKGCAEVHYHYSKEQLVEVTVDSNLDDATDIYVKKGVLIVSERRGWHDFTRYVVDVYTPDLAGVEIEGSGDFFTDDDIDTHTFTADIEGSGKITVSGVCDNLEVEISGSGDFNGQGITISHAEVEINGSGNVRLCVTSYLHVEINGSGDVYYRGNPQLSTDVNGSGDIKMW